MSSARDCLRCGVEIEDGPWIPVFDWVPAPFNRLPGQGQIMDKAETGMVHVTCPSHTELLETDKPPRRDVVALVDEWLTSLVDRWDKGSRAPHDKLHMLDDMPNLPGNVSIGEFIDEVRRRKQ